jgi:hypothetical protein
MYCKEEGCPGTIDLNDGVLLMVGCAQRAGAYPCDTCGRLHWPSGNAVSNRSGQLAFLIDGQLVHRDPPKKLDG